MTSLAQLKARRTWDRKNPQKIKEYSRKHKHIINWDYEQQKLNQADGYIEELIQKEEARLKLYHALFTDETDN